MYYAYAVVKGVLNQEDLLASITLLHYGARQPVGRPLFRATVDDTNAGPEHYWFGPCGILKLDISTCRPASALII